MPLDFSKGFHLIYTKHSYHHFPIAPSQPCKRERLGLDRLCLWKRVTSPGKQHRNPFFSYFTGLFIHMSHCFWKWGNKVTFLGSIFFILRIGTKLIWLTIQHRRHARVHCQQIYPTMFLWLHLNRRNFLWDRKSTYIVLWSIILAWGVIPSQSYFPSLLFIVFKQLTLIEKMEVN